MLECLQPHRKTAPGWSLSKTATTVPAGRRWIDLVPADAARRTTPPRASSRRSLPTREEAQEIEFSSRFYAEDGAVFMTASVLTGVDIGKPALVPLTIVVAGDGHIVTLRYEELRAQKQFLARATKPGSGCATTPAVLLRTDRGDRRPHRRRAGEDQRRRRPDQPARSSPAATDKRRGRRLAALIGGHRLPGRPRRQGAGEPASLERLLQFASVTLPSTYAKGANKNRLKLIARDVRSLEDHVAFLSNKILFLLDATLGLISVEQNEVIRVLTVAATIFFPPTLIGTVYGMNFDNMPELDWGWGYPLALLLMLASAVLPYL